MNGVLFSSPTKHHLQGYEKLLVLKLEGKPKKDNIYWRWICAVTIYEVREFSHEF